MAKMRLTMRKIKDILRLRHEAGLSYRAIAQSLNIGYGTVVDYLTRAKQAGLSWPIPEDLCERDLGRLLFPTQPVTGQRRFAEPDFPAIHLELKNKTVTKQLLWQEYRQQHPEDGYSYAQFCHRYKSWLGRQQRSMRQSHRAGEKLFVDYCGPTLIKSHRYEPVINPSYQQLAAHYHTAIVPARPYKPKDKAKAEVAVQIVERWIMARLRHQSFFTLFSLNQAIRFLLEDLNQRPFKKLPGSRASQFEQLDKPALRSLPTQPYEYAEIKQARVHIDCHIEYDKHYYSVPHHLVKQAVEVQSSSRVVAIYSQGKRLASHPRSYRQGGHTTCPEHMPPSHKAIHDWSPERFLSWADDIGEATREVVSHLLKEKRHQEQSFRRVLALLGNARKYDRDRLNKACARALAIHSPTRSSVESILKQGLDQQPLTAEEAPTQDELFLDHHENLRGEEYYH